MKNKRKRIYIWPLNSKNQGNPYIRDLADSIAEFYVISNAGRPLRLGVFELFLFLFRADIFLFNWIENLSYRKFGNLQTAIFLFQLLLIKLFGKKVAWTIHNKFGHRVNSSVVLLNRILFKHSDFIICHSREGIEWYQNKFKTRTGDYLFTPHPIKNRLTKKTPQKKYEILIWGTIAPFKGIDLFLKTLTENHQENNYRILIVGKCYDKEYDRKIRGYLNDQIEFVNEYLPFEELQNKILAAKIILFTYRGDSVLSSGALTDSLSLGANVIGPDNGAFREYAESGLVRTFKDYYELIETIIPGSLETKPDREELRSFIENNSWRKFGERISAYFNRNQA